MSSDVSPVLSLPVRDRRALAWLRDRCRVLRHRLKRRRKYLRRGAPFSEHEMMLFLTLETLADGAELLLEITGTDDNKPQPPLVVQNNRP